MTGYVVLPPGHVTLACLHVLPSEVPENVRTLGLYRITNDKIEFMDVLMKEIRLSKQVLLWLQLCLFDHSQNQELPCSANKQSILWAILYLPMLKIKSEWIENYRFTTKHLNYL